MKKFDFHKIPNAPVDFFLMKTEEDYSHLLTPDVVKRFQDEGDRLYRAHQKYTKEVIAKVETAIEENSIYPLYSLLEDVMGNAVETRQLVLFLRKLGFECIDNEFPRSGGRIQEIVERNNSIAILKQFKKEKLILGNITQDAIVDCGSFIRRLASVRIERNYKNDSKILINYPLLTLIDRYFGGIWEGNVYSLLSNPAGMGLISEIDKFPFPGTGDEDLKKALQEEVGKHAYYSFDDSPLIPRSKAPNDVDYYDLRNCLSYGNKLTGAYYFDRGALTNAVYDIYRQYSKDPQNISFGLGAVEVKDAYGNVVHNFFAYKAPVKMVFKESGRDPVAKIEFSPKLKFDAESFRKHLAPGAMLPEMEDIELTKLMLIWQNGGNQVSQILADALAPLAEANLSFAEKVDISPECAVYLPDYDFF